MRDRFLLTFVMHVLLASAGSAQSLEENVTPLVKASCLRCHGDRTATPLNLARLGFDLADHETFKAWERRSTHGLRKARCHPPPRRSPTRR